MIKIGIYKIISPSNKIYIGQSTDINSRWNDYKLLHRCNVGPKIHNSLNKHGVENHIFEIIEECSLELLDEKESFYKQQFINEFGWKFALFCQLKDGKGGYRSEETKQKIKQTKKENPYVVSEETKRKISLKNIGTKKPKSEEFGKKFSERLKGNTYRKGSKHTQEAKDKMSNALLGNKRALGHIMTEETKLKQSQAKNHLKRKIFCPELNQEFDSLTSASKELKINIGSIGSILKGTVKKTRNGLTFKYL